VKLLGRDIHTVPVGRVTVYQHQRDDLDTVRPYDLLGQVAATVRQDSDRAPNERKVKGGGAPRSFMLGPHVLGFVGDERTQSP
jgi:hypothetical protein